MESYRVDSARESALILTFSDTGFRGRRLSFLLRHLGHRRLREEEDARHRDGILERDAHDDVLSLVAG